ncbi:hypothetical protein NQ317_001621 [Molorchus minor]|uniref:ATPase AAA-type core domain-containing protein n=1 Tax=Molorchus minor TaxID=1323400 RepID=A0ABQ9JQA7_9CUCU|nr:hypothetical protein NQ317_001621 [Molorchus minor]
MIAETGVEEKDNKLNQQLPQNHTLSSKDYVETTVAIELGSSNVVGDYAMPKTNSDSQNSTLDSKGKGSLSDSQIVKSQKNAFQLMMESRNKVIGQNSPGKHITGLVREEGAYKRKGKKKIRIEIISQKLNRRKRRFKKLLKVDEPVLANEESADIIVKKRRIPSYRFNSQSDIVSDVVEENAQDGLLNNTKTEMKTKDTKQSVLSFFGILSTQKNYDRDDEKKDEETNNGASKTTEQRTSSKKDKMSKLKRKETQSQTYNEESTLSNQPILAQQSNIPKTKKKRLKDLDKKHALEDTVKTPGKDSKIVYDNDDSLTPRSKKNKNDTESENKPHASNVELTADELSGRESTAKNSENLHAKVAKLRNFRISKQSIFDQEVVLSDSEDEFVEKKKIKKPFCFSKKKLDEIVLSDDENDSEDMPVLQRFWKLGNNFDEWYSNSLKKTIEKQQSMEERTYEIFPGISHVQQRCKSTLWNLSSPQLNLPICSPIKLKQPAICSGITTNQISDKLDIQIEIQKVDKLKTLLNRIKTDNPNYPVYKSFRLIYEKSGKTQQKAKNILTNRQKEIGLDNSIEIIEPGVEEFDLIEQAMWTEKYKPKCSGDIIGNSEGIKTLKRWLENWFNFSKEINARKKKCEDSTSESEFDITDCDSRDSTRLPGNTFVVGGPCGCGKSTAIYAICEELGFNVIELNASSKRTGKRLLQELQEATQSHQVRKNEHGMQSFLQKPKPKENTKDQQKQKKWDVDHIVFHFSSYRLYRFAENKPEMNEITIKNKNHKLTQIDKIKLLSIERLYDSLALTDVMFRKIKCSDGSEPVIKNYSDDLKDGLELNECMETYDGYSEFVHEVTHVLVNGYVEDYKSIETEVSIINMALPGRSERRWRSKHHVCEDVFQEALTHLSYTDRKSVALNYLPALRNISRSERCCATNNNKRGNRFRNYLRDLNINCNDNTLKLACNILIDE